MVEFQAIFKKNFERICSDLELSVFSPLWNLNPSNYLRRMIDEKFKIIITGVSAMGLIENGLNSG